MQITKDQRSYSGASSYKFVERLIKSSNSKFMIISPFVDKYYANFLLNVASKRARHIYFITSSSKINKEALKRLTKVRIRPFVESIIFIIILDAIMLLLRFYQIFLIINIVFFAVWFGLLLSRRKIISKISIKVISKQFVHEKIYISEQEAIVGSANLTYKGMHSNIEHIEVIREQQKIADLKKHFDKLWRSY